jgi:hypothetical protein
MSDTVVMTTIICITILAICIISHIDGGKRDGNE